MTHQAVLTARIDANGGPEIGADYATTAVAAEPPMRVLLGSRPMAFTVAKQ
jgi:hypothetical protein